MIRLLTFNRWSVLRENRDECESFGSVLNQLSLVARAFDCHLLQRPTGATILDALGDESQQVRLQQTVGLQGSDVALVSPGTGVDAGFPDWMRPRVLPQQPADSVYGVVTRKTDVSSEVRLQWTHIDIPNDSTRDRWLAAALTVAVNVVHENPDDRFIVTAVSGEAHDPGRFESLLFEERIRLPLLIAGSGIGCERVANPTGSFDVLETLLEDLGESNVTVKDDRPVNLGEPQYDVQDRVIPLFHESTNAVRTSDFLLVRSVSDLHDEQIALYGKPYDVWNVHDLSREYPAMTDQLLKQLSEFLTP